MLPGLLRLGSQLQLPCQALTSLVLLCAAFVTFSVMELMVKSSSQKENGFCPHVLDETYTGFGSRLTNINRK